VGRLSVTTQCSLVNTLLELEDRPLKIFPGQVLPFIHRVLSRVHNMCTPTCIFTFRLSVPTSAYPERYLRPLLLGESCPDGHPVGTCSARPRASSGLSRSCGSFGVSLGSGFPPGLVGVNPGHHATHARPLSFPILGKPLNLRRLGSVHDGSHACLSPTHRYLLAGVARSGSGRPAFHPASRIEGQSLPWG
jgi:hypothetical protein